jgi:hypothetical protein
MKKIANVLMMVLLAGCWFSMDAEITEVTRVRSPDGKAEVVIEHISVGATAAPSYGIFVVPRGTDLKKGSNRSDYIIGSFDSLGSSADHQPSVLWTSDGRAAIVYPRFLALHSNRDSITFESVTYVVEWMTEEPNQSVSQRRGANAPQRG